MALNGLAAGLLLTIGIGWPCTILMLICFYAWKGDFQSSYNFRPWKPFDVPKDLATKIDKEAAKWLFYLGCAFWCSIIIGWAYSLITGDYDALPYIFLACSQVWVVIILVLIIIFSIRAWSLAKKTGQARHEDKSPEIIKLNLHKPRSYLTIVDWLIEAAALAGFIAGLAIVYYGGSIEPAIVPTHLGGSGTIDGYGSKWVILGFYFIALCVIYVIFTIGNRYVYRYDPANIDDKSASRTNHFLQAAIRAIKLIYLLLVAGLAAYYINVLPDAPSKALSSVIISIVIFVPLIFVFLIIAGVNYSARYHSSVK